MRKYFVALLASAGVLAQSASAFNVGVADESLVGDGIVRFVPEHFDITVTPELILSHEPSAIGAKPGNWALNPVYEDRKSVV